MILLAKSAKGEKQRLLRDQGGVLSPIKAIIKDMETLENVACQRWSMEDKKKRMKEQCLDCYMRRHFKIKTT